MDASERAATPVPLAITGLGCRYAGDAVSPEKLWQMLEGGRSAWSKIPSSRFNVGGVYHPDGERSGSTHVKGGHFLTEHPSRFDASFFSMTTEVASSMDPQYRLMLEVVYEALENAGIPLETIAGSNTSVFSGAMYRDYHDSLSRDPETLPRYFITGNADTMASNRISHFFYLRGPSVTVDTACSTTLTALHLACQTIRTGESDLAIVAGANLLLNSEVFVTMSNLGFLSPEGISYSFDARPNGFGRREGVGAIVLQSLSATKQDQNPNRAIIRETAVNQDGRTTGITMPNHSAQEALIWATYAKAGLEISKAEGRPQIFEAHGTGTLAGDPQEAEAIASAFFKNDRADPDSGVAHEKLHVGNIKTIVGHTEGTAGLAGLMKASFAVRNGIIPPNLLFEKLSSRVAHFYNHLKITTEPLVWPEVLPGYPRRASANPFGEHFPAFSVLIIG